MASQPSPCPDAIIRSAENEQGDLEDAVRNAVDGAYLDWPNEAGVSASPFMLDGANLDGLDSFAIKHRTSPPSSCWFWGRNACPDHMTIRLLMDD